MNNENPLAELEKRIRRDAEKVQQRMDTLSALEKQGQVAIEPIILELENTAESNAAWFAAKLLGQMGNEKAVGPLITALSSGNSVLRKYAAEALGSLKNNRATEPLIRALDDPDGEVRENAAWALRSIGAPEATQILVYHVVKGDVSSECLRELGENTESFLVIHLNASDTNLRVGAARTLGELQNQNVGQTLIGLLQNDASSDVRCAAAYALGESKNLSALEALITALNDSNQYVRANAAEGLGKLGDKRAVVSLTTSIHEDDQVVRKSAAWALNWIHNLSDQ